LDPIFAIALLSVWMSDETPLLVFVISLLRVLISDETLALTSECLTTDETLHLVYDVLQLSVDIIRIFVAQTDIHHIVCTTQLSKEKSRFHSEKESELVSLT